MPRLAALYLRQSEYVAEGIDRQRERCTALAEAKGWEVVTAFEDNDTSASKVRGPKTQWFQMLAAAARKDFDVVIAVDLDRLLRSIGDLTHLIDSGAKVVTVDGEIDLSTADGEFRATMLAAIARFEVRRKAERQKRANAYRVGQGMPVPGGRRRFGFEADHITPNRVEAHWIRVIYRGVAEGKSLRSLARCMNDAGVPCVTKGKWNAPRLQKIATNPAYRGRIIHHGKAWPSDKVPVIIPPALASRVDAVMNDPSRRKTQGSERSALMGGLGECGSCHAPLISAGTKAKGVAIATYGCSAVKGGQTGAQGHPSIRRAILDKAVTEAVVAAFVMGRPTDFAEHGGGDVVKVDRELRALAKRKANLLSLVASEASVKLSDVAGELREIAKAAGVASERKTSIEAESAHARMLTDLRAGLFTGERASIADAAALATELEQRFNRLDLHSQRVLIRDLLHVVVHPGKGSKRVKITHRVVTSLNEDDGEREE